MAPGFIAPVETRHAPTTITAASPVFNIRLIRGPEAAMVMLALASAAFKRLLTVSYRSFSYSVRLKALMTRDPGGVFPHHADHGVSGDLGLPEQGDAFPG